MADLESIRAVLHSKYIDPSNVKPYTGLHINTTGEKKNSLISISRAKVRLTFLFQEI